MLPWPLWLRWRPVVVMLFAVNAECLRKFFSSARKYCALLIRCRPHLHQQLVEPVPQPVHSRGVATRCQPCCVDNACYVRVGCPSMCTTTSALPPEALSRIYVMLYDCIPTIHLAKLHCLKARMMFNKRRPNMLPCSWENTAFSEGHVNHSDRPNR